MKRDTALAVVGIVLVVVVVGLFLNSQGLLHFGPMPGPETQEALRQQEIAAAVASELKKLRLAGAGELKQDQPSQPQQPQQQQSQPQPPVQQAPAQQTPAQTQTQAPAIVAPLEDKGKELGKREDGILPTVSFLGTIPDPQNPGCVLITLRACCGYCIEKPQPPPKPAAEKPRPPRRPSPKKVVHKPAPPPERLPVIPGNFPCDKKQGGRLIEVQTPRSLN